MTKRPALRQRRALFLAPTLALAAFASSGVAQQLDAYGNPLGAASPVARPGPTRPLVRFPWEASGMLRIGVPPLIRTCKSPVKANAGLTFDGRYLWIADWKTRRALQFDPSNCSVVRSIPLPGGQYPTGLAWGEGVLWHADGNQNEIYMLDPADGAVLRSFPSPGGFPAGLAFVHGRLWNSDSYSNYFSSTPDEIHIVGTVGVLHRTLPAIGGFPTGMAFDGHYIWHADNLNQMIYAIDPRSGLLVRAFAAPGPYPNELAWDGELLWVLENGADMLYAYDVR